MVLSSTMSMNYQFSWGFHAACTYCTLLASNVHLFSAVYVQSAADYLACFIRNDLHAGAIK